LGTDTYLEKRNQDYGQSQFVIREADVAAHAPLVARICVMAKREELVTDCISLRSGWKAAEE
jgi:hypothetical protein